MAHVLKRFHSFTCTPPCPQFTRNVFTALHGMQTWSSNDKFCLSVHPSVKRVHRDKTEERSVQIIYTTRKII